MHETFDGKGLTILSATGEGKDVVDGFVEALGPTYPILCQAGGEVNQYSTGGVPTAYLIGAEGAIVWQGHPGDLKDSDIEEQLKDVAKEHRVSSWSFLLTKALPAVPDKLADAKKLLEKMKFGAALKKVEASLSTMEGDEAEAATQLRDWIQARATSALEKAEALVKDGKVYAGYLAYLAVEERFSDHALGKQAKDAAKALKSDKTTGLEIKASEKFEEIKKEMAGEQKPEDKLKCLKPLLADKYAETAAGKEAAKLAEELEAKIEATK